MLKYQQRVANLVSRYIRDMSETQDVTQEAFIKAYRALPGFGEIVRFIPGSTGSPSTPPRIIWLPEGVGRPEVISMQRPQSSLMSVSG